jgi:hypothetical protein
MVPWKSSQIENICFHIKNLRTLLLLGARSRYKFEDSSNAVRCSFFFLPSLLRVVIGLPMAAIEQDSAKSVQLLFHAESLVSN